MFPKRAAKRARRRSRRARAMGQTGTTATFQGPEPTLIVCRVSVSPGRLPPLITVKKYPPLEFSWDWGAADLLLVWLLLLFFVPMEGDESESEEISMLLLLQMKPIEWVDLFLDSSFSLDSSAAVRSMVVLLDRLIF